MTEDDWRLRLLEYLKRRDYEFTAVTPATHERVLARPLDGNPSLRDVFGWNRTFAPDALEAELLEVMRGAGCLAEDGPNSRSTLRVASLDRDLFLHSQFPTEDAHAVFFGPDTYRFARFLRQRFPSSPPRRIVDLGAGSGAGGIAARRAAPGAAIVLVDTNPGALALAGINARAAGVEAELVHGTTVPVDADLVIANPPYMMDEGNRTYRDGGEETLGGDVALEWAADALDRLVPGGTLLLYTGVAFADGRAPFLQALARLAGDRGATIGGEQMDPDVFGEELAKPAYAKVERIAAMGFRLDKPE